MIPKIVQKPKHQPVKTLVGGLYYLLLIFIPVGLVQLGFLPGQIITWIRRSANPSATLYLASAAVSGVLWFTSKLIVGGTVKFEFLGSWKVLKDLIGLLKNYIIGVYRTLEIAIGVVSLVCGLYVWATNPFCATLAVTFDVVTNGASSPSEMVSGNSLSITAGDSFLITARAPGSGQTFACEWETSGNAIDFVGTPHDCATNVLSVANQRGEAVLVVRARNVCNQTMVFPVKVFTSVSGN